MRELPLHFHLNCSRFDKERRALIRVVTTVYNKNGCFTPDFDTEKVLGEHNFKLQDSKLISSEIEKYITSTKKEI